MEEQLIQTTEGEETTKVKATELYANAKERFGTNSILLEFFN